MRKRWVARAGLLAAALAAWTAGAADNPLARSPAWGTTGQASIVGAWNGSDIEGRSGCTSASNNGNRGTYAEFDLSTDVPSHTLGIDQKGITTTQSGAALNCTYAGPYTGTGTPVTWSGIYSCTDGKHGTFTSRAIVVTENTLFLHLDVHLDTTETCTIDKVIAAGRLYP